MPFIEKRDKELVYYTIKSFEDTNLVKHGFSTRLGGESRGDLDSLNLGIHKNDSVANILSNYKTFTNSLEIDLENLVLTDQVHKDKVMEVDAYDRGKGIVKKTDIRDTDGFITNKSRVALVTFHADCVPVFYLDPTTKAIGLVHAGWKGTVEKIGRKTLEKMIKSYGTDPSEVLIGIGPSIGQCCFEVGKEVIEIVDDSFEKSNKYYYKKDNDKYMLDLWELNRDQLIEMGVKEENITVSNICTKCNNDIFFSHRGDNGKTGSLAAIIELK